MPERPAGQSPDKWEILRDLACARAVFGLSERTISVLQALLSFHPARTLDGPTLVVFPSNRAICERLHGMACSTMRRHLGLLVECGVIARRDSPNGKRYARRGHAPAIFGFDLAPLAARAQEIAATAETCRATEERRRHRRETLSLMRRDLIALAEHGTREHPDHWLWEQIRDAVALIGRALRRKLSEEDLNSAQSQLARLLEQAKALLFRPATPQSGTNDIEIEQHHQNSETDTLESEEAMSTDKDALLRQIPVREGALQDTPPALPLHLVLASCPSLSQVHPEPIRHWNDLMSLAETLSRALGVSPSAWAEAQKAMGRPQAAIVLAAMLERFESIRSPGGYLRSLSRKAANNGFSPTPMILALLNKRAA